MRIVCFKAVLKPGMCFIFVTYQNVGLSYDQNIIYDLENIFSYFMIHIIIIVAAVSLLLIVNI